MSWKVNACVIVVRSGCVYKSWGYLLVLQRIGERHCMMMDYASEFKGTNGIAMCIYIYVHVPKDGACAKQTRCRCFGPAKDTLRQGEAGAVERYPNVKSSRRKRVERKQLQQRR